MLPTTPHLLAQRIINPVLDRWGGSQDGAAPSGTLMADIIVTLWRVLISLGGLAVLVYLLMGGLNWLTAGGDKAKVQAARDKITNAVIGMAILFASIAIVNYLGPAIGFDILNLSFPNNTSQ